MDLPIVPRDQCQELLRTTRLGRKFKLHESFLCAGGVAGADTCKVSTYIQNCTSSRDMCHNTIGITS